MDPFDHDPFNELPPPKPRSYRFRPKPRKPEEASSSSIASEISEAGSSGTTALSEDPDAGPSDTTALVTNLEICFFSPRAEQIKDLHSQLWKVKVTTTYRKASGNHMGGKVLFEGPTRPELIAGRNLPEAHGRRLHGYPTVDTEIFVIA